MGLKLRSVPFKRGLLLVFALVLGAIAVETAAPEAAPQTPSLVVVAAIRDDVTAESSEDAAKYESALVRVNQALVSSTPEVFDAVTAEDWETVLGPKAPKRRLRGEALALAEFLSGRATGANHGIRGYGIEYFASGLHVAVPYIEAAERVDTCAALTLLVALDGIHRNARDYPRRRLTRVASWLDQWAEAEEPSLATAVREMPTVHYGFAEVYLFAVLMLSGEKLGDVPREFIDQRTDVLGRLLRGLVQEEEAQLSVSLGLPALQATVRLYTSANVRRWVPEANPAFVFLSFDPIEARALNVREGIVAARSQAHAYWFRSWDQIWVSLWDPTSVLSPEQRVNAWAHGLMLLMCDGISHVPASLHLAALRRAYGLPARAQPLHLEMSTDSALAKHEQGSSAYRWVVRLYEQLASVQAFDWRLGRGIPLEEVRFRPLLPLRTATACPETAARAVGERWAGETQSLLKAVSLDGELARAAHAATAPFPEVREVLEGLRRVRAAMEEAEVSLSNNQAFFFTLSMAECLGALRPQAAMEVRKQLVALAADSDQAWLMEEAIRLMTMRRG